MIEEASEQMTELLDEVGVAARIEGGPLGAGLAGRKHLRARDLG